MRLFAQRPAAPLSVLIENHANRLSLRLGEPRRVALRPLLHREPASMFFVKLGNHRPVCPCLDGLFEQGLTVPYEMPRLRVVDELLELPGVHRSLLLKDVLRYVVSRWHMPSISVQLSEQTPVSDPQRLRTPSARSHKTLANRIHGPRKLTEIAALLD